ncbi:hypothetical protein GCM10009611_05860 [Arthrobacter roseus]
MIATTGDPACQGYGLSNVLGPQGAEFMCAQHNVPFGLQQRVPGMVNHARPPIELNRS